MKEGYNVLENILQMKILQLAFDMEILVRN